MDGVAKRVIEELMTHVQGGSGSERSMRSSKGQAAGSVTDTSAPSSAGTYAMTDLPSTPERETPEEDNTQHPLIKMPSMDDVAVEGSSTSGPTRSARRTRVTGEAPSGDDGAGSGGAGNRPEGK